MFAANLPKVKNLRPIFLNAYNIKESIKYLKYFFKRNVQLILVGNVFNNVLNRKVLNNYNIGKYVILTDCFNIFVKYCNALL